MIARYLTRLLTQLGHSVVGPFGTLEKATLGAEDPAIEVAMLDINLPDGSSLELGRSLVARGVRVFFVTGNPNQAVPEDLRECSIIPKPFSRREIAEHLA